MVIMNYLLYNIVIGLRASLLYIYAYDYNERTHYDKESGCNILLVKLLLCVRRLKEASINVY